MTEIEPEDLETLIDTRVTPLILDVRSAAEFDAGHIPGARNVPFWTMAWTRELPPPPPNDPVVVYCGHGPRAAMAASVLHLRGFKDVRLLRGHMVAWRRAGRRTVV